MHYKSGMGKILPLEKSFPVKVHHRGHIVLTLMVTTDSYFLILCYMISSYGNVSVYLYMEGAKKLVLATAEEHVYTHSNQLTNNPLMDYKPLIHTGIQGYVTVFKFSNSSYLALLKEKPLQRFNDYSPD